MSNFFLINETLDNLEFELFLEGVYVLNNIKKEKDHNFKKHSSLYNLNNYEKLFQNFGQSEQLVVKYIEQLSVYNEEYIDNDERAFQSCNSHKNGFLGIDFSQINIQEIKRISDDFKYRNWIYNFSNNFDNLKNLIPNCNFSNTFVKIFEDLDNEVQMSIIKEFKKAKDRNFKTAFYPDTKIIKDVTQENFDYPIMELRIYSPIAIRVYFNELNDSVNLLSIEKKSNADQNNDIIKAYKKYKKMYNL